MISQYWDNFEKRTKALFYSLEFTNGFRRNITSALALLYFISLGHDAALTALMFGIARLILAFFELPTGAFADHYSRKTSIIISFSLMTIAFTGLFIFTNFWFLSLFFILHDIAWAFQSGISTAWIVDNLNYSKDKLKIASIFSRFFFSEKLGGIIGGLIALVVVAISFRSIWLLVAIINLFMTLILYFWMQESNFTSKKDDDNFFNKILVQVNNSVKYYFNKNNDSFRGLIAGGFLITIFLDSFLIIAPLVFSQTLGLANNQVAGLFSLLGVFVLVAPFIGEQLAKKYDLKKPLVICALLSFIIILGFDFSQSLILSAILMGLFFIFDYVAVVIFETAVQNLIPSNMRASLGSSTNVIWSIAYFLAASLMAFSIKFLNLFYSVLISASFAFFAFFAYYFLFKDD